LSNSVRDWVADKLTTDQALEVVSRTPEDFLVVKQPSGYSFMVAVLGIKNVVEHAHVAPLFTGSNQPELVINVPSKALWSGPAIDHIHAASAAFGTLGDVSRAARTGDAGSYRNKNMSFFINAIRQHSNVTGVSYIYERVLGVQRRSGPSLNVVVVDAYNMSAEDVRNAKDRYGHFDIVLKGSSYGAITYHAEQAAALVGAEALTFKDLIRRLGK
jgi:hypothetical protein